VSDRVDLSEFVGAFVAEADELITASNGYLLELDGAGGTGKPKVVRDLFRALHTIKGLAAMIGVEPIVEIAHGLETLLRTADRGGGQLGRGAIEVSLQGVKAIGERVRSVADGKAVAPAPKALLDAIGSTEASSEDVVVAPTVDTIWDARLSTSERQQLAEALRSGRPTFTLTFVPSETLASRGITIAPVRARLAQLGEIVKVAPRTLLDASGAQAGLAFDVLLISSASTAELAEATASRIEDVVPLRMDVAVGADQPIAPAEEEPAKATMGKAVVRVDLARLDELQDQLSLMIVSRFRLAREIAALAARGVDTRALREIAELQQRQLRDLRKALLAARMVRVAEVLEPLSLLVRSLARSSHKEVRLEIDARDAELDKTVADRLLPAMIHLVRNSVDHALEPDREALGKPAAGTIRVTCAQVAGNQLELIVEDDGRGIDRAKIAARARRPIANEIELLDALCAPGFSTRDTASQTSGRGLGMDIVKRIAVADLGGELTLTTEVGRGTRFKLRVPLSIAIIDVFSFECGPQAFVVPVAAIDEIFELEEAGTTTPGGRVQLVERRGVAVPLLSLGVVLAIDAGTHARKALLTRRNGEPVAFAVDRMLGRHEVVVRPVDDPLVHWPGIAGATDLGDGKPTLVLDLAELAIAVRHGGVS
jgi:two-component system chemotaxis sensor kinase CheA